MSRERNKSRRHAAIYARVSTEDQSAEGVSLDHQVRRCRQVAEDQGFEVVSTFVDGGVSGTLRNRPQLDELMELVTSGALDAVFVLKTDRLGRRLSHLLELVERFEELGVRFVAVDDAFDPTTPTGKAMMQMCGTFAELERNFISARVTAGMEERVRSGGWPGGPAPYGFRIEANPHGSGKVLALSPAEAEVVRLAYLMLVGQGRTTGEVAKEFNERGIAPRRAKTWNHKAVRTLLLDSPALSGRWVYHRPANGWDADAGLELSVPPILSVDEYEQLQAVLSETTTERSRRRVYALSGFLVSPHGVAMQGHPGKSGDVRWYRCPHRFADNVAPEQRCSCHSVNAQRAEDAVWREVVALLGSPESLEALAATMDGGDPGSADRIATSISEARAEIEALAAEIASEYERMREAGFIPTVIDAALRSLNERMERLEQRQRELGKLRTRNLRTSPAAGRLRALSAHAERQLADATADLRPARPHRQRGPLGHLPRL